MAGKYDKAFSNVMIYYISSMKIGKKARKINQYAIIAMCLLMNVYN